MILAIIGVILLLWLASVIFLAIVSFFEN